MGKIVSVQNTIARLPDARNTLAYFAGSPNVVGNSVLLPQNLLLSPGTLYEDFETVGDWTAANGSVAANTSEFKTGTQSIKLTTNAGVTATMTKTVNWDCSGPGDFSMWVYIHNAAYADYGNRIFHIILANDSGLNNSLWGYCFTSEFWGGVGWHRLHVPKSYFYQIGTGTFASPIIRVRISCFAAATKIAEESFDQLEFGERHRPAVMIRFDDGFGETYNIAYPYMKARGIPGTHYTESSIVSTASYITWAQLREMDIAGWSIGNHTRSHTALKGISEANQETAIANGITDLEANGLSRCAHYLAYPGGGTNPGFDDNTFVAMANTGTLIGHSYMAVCAANGDVPGMQVQTLPDNLYGDMYHIRDATFTSATTLAQAKTALDNQILAGGLLAPLFHQLDAGGQWTSADFRAFVDYVYAKKQAGLVNVITIDDYYRLTLGPVEIPLAE